jgi:enamine deaminase RidA (YjgF/YER057c/UK114 family)
MIMTGSRPASSPRTSKELAMKRKAINPSSLYQSVPFGFSHAVEQNGGRTLHLSGQVAWDGEGRLVGAGDLVAQTRQALANLKVVLAEVGATPADVVRLRTYVVNHSPEKLGPVTAEIAAFYGDALPAANTFIGVQALALPDFLVEIEAIAAL